MSNAGKNNLENGNSVPSGHSSESLLVRLQRILPAKFIGRIVRRAALSQQVQFKNILIKSFISLYNVDLSDALNSDPESYKSFNDFFTRELKAGARPIDESSNAVCSPADGTLAEFGSIRGSQMIQAKGIHYTIEQLFAGQELSAQQFTSGTFATVYLAPYNYHRVHMPLAGTLIESIYVPGKLLSVNAATTAEVQGLYAENERLIHIFKSDGGPFAVIMVGALNVGSMTTAWGGEIPPHVRNNVRHIVHTSDEPNIHYQKGDYLGHFNLGSTVIFIAGAEQINWESNLKPGMTTWVGERMGHRN